ncbi:hypothetical protein [Methylobacterium sp. JK268]
MLRPDSNQPSAATSIILSDNTATYGINPAYTEPKPLAEAALSVATAVVPNGGFAVLHDVAAGASLSRVLEVTPGSGIARTVTLQTDEATSTGDVTLTALANNRYLATWQTLRPTGAVDGGGNRIYDRIDLVGAVVDDAGTVIAANLALASIDIGATVVGPSGQDSVTALQDGGFAVAFGIPGATHQSVTTLWQVSGSSYAPARSWPPLLTGQTVVNQVSTLADGSVLVAAYDAAGSHGIEVAQIHAATGGFSGPSSTFVVGSRETVSTGGRGFYSHGAPALTPLADGKVLAVVTSSASIETALAPSPTTNPIYASGTKDFAHFLTVAAGQSATDRTPLTGSSAPVLNDFGVAQGWGSADTARSLHDIDHNGSVDYLGFGSDTTFVSNGISFPGPGFTNPAGVVHDFGTSQGYDAASQRGSAAAGYGVADILYGQGDAGIYWYGATRQDANYDALGGIFGAQVYETAPHLYADYGRRQGWTAHNGFQIVRTQASDPYASILGFAQGGVLVGNQAFAPTADASTGYTVLPAVGNGNGWDQLTDIRTFQDNDGAIIDLNNDGIADFLGMGPGGTSFALGTKDGGGRYGLGPLQTATFNGNASDFGRAQGWTDQGTTRLVVHDDVTGYDDIIAFGANGVLVAQGQDPTAHQGQPFGPIHLGIADFGVAQGWSNDLTPRRVGDINGDGTPDIVGFGADATLVAVGSRDAVGTLTFTLDPSKTINDFGYNEGWDSRTLRMLGDVDSSGHDSLVLSGAAGTQVWSL